MPTNYTYNWHSIVLFHLYLADCDPRSQAEKDIVLGIIMVSKRHFYCGWLLNSVDLFFSFLLTSGSDTRRRLFS
jgi:hypothetical protein